jgi:hypothetical protein
MKIKNTTPFETAGLRRMLGWIADRLGLRRSFIREATFTRYRYRWRGTAWPYDRRVMMRVSTNPANYPALNVKYPGRKRAPIYSIFDGVEALVKVSAHELQHLHDAQEGARNGEAYTDSEALRVLALFRDDRAALLAAWGLSDLSKPLPKTEKARKPKASTVAAKPKPLPKTVTKAPKPTAKWTYRQELVCCGRSSCRLCAGVKYAHGPYWYAYQRQGTRIKKKYIGKNAPPGLTP